MQRMKILMFPSLLRYVQKFTTKHSVRKYGKNLWPRSVDIFMEQTAPHYCQLYADALCLTGNSEDAAYLVEITYEYAFRSYKHYQMTSLPEETTTVLTLAWMLKNMHIAYVDWIKRSASCVSPLISNQEPTI